MPARAVQHDRRGPRRPVGPIEFPSRLARLDVEAHRERIVVRFDLHDHRVADDHGRRRHAQAVARLWMLISQPAKPQQVSVAVEAGQIVARIKGDDPVAVAGRRRRGDGHLRMALRAARGPELPVPHDRSVGRRTRHDVQPVLIVSAACRDDHPIADDDRSGNPLSRQAASTRPFCREFSGPPSATTRRNRSRGTAANPPRSTRRRPGKPPRRANRP